MSENRRLGQPFKELGARLKALREQSKRTIAEVSGAVEIDTQNLEQFEKGEQRPAEDILSLLISFFEIKDDEATTLWKMAGYDDNRSNNMSSQTTFDLNQQIAMIMPVDQRVVYTDMVHVMINNFGVVMNFMQGAGPNNQPLAVARVGMSKEHAKSVIEILQQSLKQAEIQESPKLLDSPNKTPEKSSDQIDKTSDV